MRRYIEIQNIFLQKKMCGILSTEGVLIWCESEEALHRPTVSGYKPFDKTWVLICLQMHLTSFC